MPSSNTRTFFDPRECQADCVHKRTNTARRRQNEIIARFLEFLRAHPSRPLYLTEICAAIGVAERTLRLACAKHLGMGPIRYLTLRRMLLVRDTLLRAEASNTTVTRVALDHGFF